MMNTHRQEPLALPAPVSKLITDAIDDGIFPGAAISIGDQHGEIFRGHFGSRSLLPEILPMEAATLFDLASLTKIVATTMVTLALVERGKLSLDDTLGQFFNTPGEDNHIPQDKQPITIRQLMTHTSGLPAHAPLYNLAQSARDVYGTILDMPLLAKPGENVVYSCLGFILLGRICELVSGTGLDHLAQQLVFNPLGLKNTGYTPKMQGNTFAATEYCSTSGVWLNGVVHDENARFMGGVSGNAGVFSNINDCAALAIMFANKGNGIVPQALFEAATQNLTTHCEEGRGLGFAVKGRAAVSCGNIFSQGSYGHTGFTGTSMWVDGETSQYVVFLTNRVHPTRENNRLAGFRSVLHDACAREYQTFMQWQ